MANKKPRKKKQEAPTKPVSETASEAAAIKTDAPPVVASATSKDFSQPTTKIDYKDLLPTGLYRQIQELKERLEKIETLLGKTNQ